MKTTNESGAAATVPVVVLSPVVVLRPGGRLASPRSPPNSPSRTALLPETERTTVTSLFNRIPCRRRRTLAAVACLPAILGAAASAADPPNATKGAASKADARAVDADSLAVPSEAERIAAVQGLLAEDRRRLATLQQEADALEPEFQTASAEFGRLDATRTAARQAVAADPAEAERLAKLGAEWKESRSRFDLLIERRKATARQLGTLQDKIAVEESGLRRLTDAAGETAAPTGPPAATAAPAPAATAPKTSAPILEPDVLHGLSPVAPPAPAAPAEEVPAAPAEDAQPEDEQVVEARKTLADAQAGSTAADARVRELDAAVEVFERDVDGTQALLDADRKELAAAEAAVAAAGDSANGNTANGNTANGNTANGNTANGNTANRERVASARGGVDRQSARLEELRGQIERLRTVRAAAAEKADVARSAVEKARQRLDYYESPLAPSRVRKWFTGHALKVLVVLALMLALWWLARIVGRRVVGGFVRRGRRGTSVEREMRAETLGRVFQNAAGLAIAAIGGLAMLDQAGFDVTVLVGGAAVAGAAIAFGAQNLIKDYFSGFMILVENQYSVGNVIRLGETVGTVEDVTLRMTVLRDLEGVVHFVPHNQVTTVSNLTYGWSRVVFDVGIGYGEDVDRVMEVLMDLARELRDDETFGPMTLGEPEMLGVDEFAESAVVIKFLVKTRPLKQWLVKRELLRRIKNEFDRRGIEIPFPHRTLHLGGPAAPLSLASRPAVNGSISNGHAGGPRNGGAP